MTQEPEQIAAGLTEAQRDTMLGHLVEISPEEARQLEDMGLKSPPFTVIERVSKIVWPITKTGHAVRAVLERGDG